MQLIDIELITPTKHNASHRPAAEIPASGWAPACSLGASRAGYWVDDGA
jgi:hypothetical protein